MCNLRLSLPILRQLSPRYLPFLLILFFSAGGMGCADNPSTSQDTTTSPNQETETENRPVALSTSGAPLVLANLDSIKARGKLVALTSYSATSYFIYRGQPLGYEYELLQSLGDYLDVEVEIKLARDLDEMFSLLAAGEGDLIAYNLTVTSDRLKKVDFTFAHTITRQVLVQRKPEGWRKMQLHQIQRQLITTPIDLIDKEVYVRKGSSYIGRLKNLSDEIGGNITINQSDEFTTTEELIRRVSEGDIQFTIADENLAQINKAYYSDLDISTPVSLPQRIAWAVRPGSPELLAAVNDWMDKVKSEPTWNSIYAKYYKNKRDFRRRARSEYFSVNSNRISEYDALIQQYADSIGWDWRLLASQIYQESQFDPNAESWVGAAGLMQLMPATGKQYGVTNRRNPTENIRGGVEHLQWLDNYWSDKITDPNQRLRFILGSYNTGHGHVADARRLAEHFGEDPNVWFNVAIYLRLKSEKQYYQNPVVRFGYCRGEEPVNYVIEILERYGRYRSLLNTSGDV